MIAAINTLLCGLSLGVVPTGASSASPVETIGVLSVAPAPGAGPELADITEKLRGELTRKLDGVLSASELRARMKGRASAASLSDLERAYAGAQEELKREPARGIEWLRAIRADLLKQPDSAEAFALWIRSTLRLARARLEYATSAEDATAGQAEARTLVESLVRAKPDIVIDPLEHSRRIERLAAEVRASLAKVPRRKLTVKSSAADTLVFVNGREVGRAPVVVTLPAGDYRVSGLRGVLYAPPEKATVGEQDQMVNLDFSLVDIFRPDRGPGLAVSPADEDRMVLRAAVWLGMDRVVTTGLQKEKDVEFLVTKVLDVKPHATVPRQGWIRLSQGSVPLGGYADLANFLLTNAYTGPVVPSAVMDPGSRALKGPAITNRPGATKLGWTSFATAGLAVVLTGVAIQQSSVASGYYDDAHGILVGGSVPAGQGSRYNALIDKGDSAKRNAIAFGVGAGVSLAVAVTTGVVNKRSTGQFWPFLF